METESQTQTDIETLIEQLKKQVKKTQNKNDNKQQCARYRTEIKRWIFEGSFHDDVKKMNKHIDELEQRKDQLNQEIQYTKKMRNKLALTIGRYPDVYKNRDKVQD
jgi:peptidoglycan hydrolase CwlO-like protein